MPVPIHLDDALASQLKVKASVRQLSLEAFAQHLLGGALEKLDATEKWQAQNRRRLSLIRKGTACSLTPEEEAELEQLQAALDRQLESVDDQLLEGLDRLTQAIEQRTDGPKPE